VLQLYVPTCITVKTRVQSSWPREDELGEGQRMLVPWLQEQAEAACFEQVAP